MLAALPIEGECRKMAEAEAVSNTAPAVLLGVERYVVAQVRDAREECKNCQPVHDAAV